MHTTEIQDGYDWGRLNLQSITEESSFQEFLAKAELAGTEFQGEKMNISFVNSTNVGLLTADQRKKLKKDHEDNRTCLKIPRRPQWNSQTTPDELQLLERTEFFEWRRNLAILEEEQGLLLTPFEKNLEFWRQLWRVVERSDVIVQIVDARNPLLFRCEDLEKYVKEISENKLNLILVNKSDFLTEEQREIWANYFSEENIKVAFFSAIEKDKIIEKEEESDDETRKSTVNESENELAIIIPKSNCEVLNSSNKTKNKPPNINLKSGNENLNQKSIQNNFLSNKITENVNITYNSNKDINNSASKSVSKEQLNEEINKLDESVEKIAQKLHNITKEIITSVQSNQSANTTSKPFNNSKLLTREELITLFQTIHTKSKVTSNITTVGLVGYPNVGKSSTINSLLQMKKVSVSATPGKTKHFQTHYLDTDLLLCDCPGLVMPSFVFTKAEMIINGILPIDRMRDHVAPVNLVASLIPRHVFEEKYGIMLPISEDEGDRPPTSEELLNAYGCKYLFLKQSSDREAQKNK